MRLTIAAAMLAGLTVTAAAQMIGPGMAPPGVAPGGQRLPPCYNEFTPIRSEAERRAALLQVAMKKKVPREEACRLIKSFAEAEAKVVKFIQTNAQWCGIPADAAGVMQKNHARTIQTQNQVCAAGAAGPARPTGPGLSEALGTSRGVIEPGAQQNGTFDTLTGNVLTR
jgi:hypothetical protein